MNGSVFNHQSLNPNRISFKLSSWKKILSHGNCLESCWLWSLNVLTRLAKLSLPALWMFRAGNCELLWVSWKQRNQVGPGKDGSYCSPLVLFASECIHAQTSCWATWLIILYTCTEFFFKEIVTFDRHDLICKLSIPKAGNGPREPLFYGVLLWRGSAWDPERASDLFKATSKFRVSFNFFSSRQHGLLYPKGIMWDMGHYTYAHMHTQTQVRGRLGCCSGPVLLFLVNLKFVKEYPCLPLSALESEHMTPS